VARAVARPFTHISSGAFVMARHGIAGTLLLVAFVTACGSESTAPAPASNSRTKGPDVPPVSAVVGSPGSTLQLRQVFAGTATWVGVLEGNDKLWGRSTDIWNPGSHLFEDFMVIVPAGRSTSIEMWGGSQDADCEVYTPGWLPDTYLYVFDFETKAYVTRNDDAFNCVSSFIVLHNESNVGKRYILRATSYRSYAPGEIDEDSGITEGTGRYRLWIRTPAGPCPVNCDD